MKNIVDFFAKRREKVKITDIREYLFQQLIDNSDGFERIGGSNRDGITRKKEYGKDVFYVMIHTRRYGYAIEAEAYKRFDELEAIYAEFFVNRELLKYTNTIGERLSKLLDRTIPTGYQVAPNYEFDIITRYDLERVTKKMITLLKRTEKVFFERYNSYQELYDIVNVDIRKIGKYDITYSSKAFLGLTLSRLLKDKNYEALKETYLDQVAKFVPSDIPKFQILIKRLEENY